MSPDEIKAKAATLAELYAAKAAGKTLQYLTDVWAEVDESSYGPHMQSELSRWRVKPEPRRMWTVPTPHDEEELFVVETVWTQADADHLKSCGYTVTEWMEVIP